MSSLAIRSAALAAALALAPAPLAARQSPVPADTLHPYLLPGVTVTATRSPTPRAAVPQKVEVIGRAEIERTVASGLADVLKKSAALDVIQYPGLLSGVSIRGFRPQFNGISQRTLILIDGRPAGLTNLATVEMAAVERVEVLKGPASALYGSSAMGGVVNLVTRRSRGPVRGRAEVGAGSFGTYDGEVVVGGSLARALDFDLSLASTVRDAGYRIGGNRLFGGDSLTKVLPDGSSMRVGQLSLDSTVTFAEYAQRSGSARLGYEVAPGWRLEARGEGFVADEVQNPGDLLAPYDNRTVNDLERYTGEAGATGALGAHALSLRAYAARERSTYYSRADEPRFASFVSPTAWRGWQLQDVLSLGAHSLTLGVDHSLARSESEVYSAAGVRSAPYSPDASASSTAAFGQGFLSLLDERLTATLGGRLDRVAFEVYETALFGGGLAASTRESRLVFNPSAGVQYRAPAGVRLHSTVGRAFVNPDPFYVAGYSESRAGTGAVNVTRGNPDLDPESSLTWDAGVGILRGGLEADLTYFSTDVRDRITRVPPTPGSGVTARGDSVRSVATFANADRGEIRGVEAFLAYDLGALRLFGNATRLLRAEETTGPRTTRIQNVADLTLVYGVEYDDRRRLSARLSGRYVGERWDADYLDWSRPGEIGYPAFNVLDLSARLRLAERLHLGVQVGNLTDENYFEVRGYNLPGRTLRLEVGAAF